MWELIGESTVVWRFVAMPAGTHSGYVWHWLCENGRGEVLDRSTGGYRFYYDCLENARMRGYTGLPRSVGANAGAPAGSAAGRTDGAQGVST